MYAVVLKTPLGILALAVWAAFRTLRRCGLVRRGSTRTIALLAIPISFFVFVSSQTGFSHHLRYVLPVLPFLALGVGSLGPLLRRAGRPRTVIGLLTIAGVASVVQLVPHQLSYFNALGGGWERGDAHLIDSNIDWGQDLGSLAVWERRHRAEGPLGIAYFGGIDPHVVGLEYALPPLEPSPGRFALSVNFVRGMRFVAVDGAGRPVALREGTYAYFQQWQPTARIGTSIRVYDVTPEQADDARRKLGLALQSR